MLVSTIAVDEAGDALDRDLPAAGNQLALHAAQHEQQIAPSTISIHSAQLVKGNGLAGQIARQIGSIMNWCIGSILASAAT